MERRVRVRLLIMQDQDQAWFDGVASRVLDILFAVPGIIFAGAALLVAFYPLEQKRYNQVLARIQDMEAGRVAPGIVGLGG